MSSLSDLVGLGERDLRLHLLGLTACMVRPPKRPDLKLESL